MRFWPAQQTPKVTLGTYGPPLLGRPVSVDPRQHFHVQGLTGQGKSKLLVSTTVQLINQGVGCAVVDPHTDAVDEILGVLLDTGFFANPQAYERLLYIDFSRTDRFLPFNILNGVYDPHTVARNIVEVCKRAWPALADGSAPQFENIALASVVVLVENHLPLSSLPRLLTDKLYRDGLLDSVTDPEVVHFFHARFDEWGKDAPLMIESTLRRAFLLTFSPTLRYSLGQAESALDFRRLLDNGTSVLFNLGGLDEETQRFLGCLLTVGFEVAALSRADIPEEKRNPYMLILDEFSMFSAQSEESLSRILSLCRKYGLFLTLAHQTWSQLSDRLKGAVQNTLDIAFKLGRSDAEWAAPRFGQFDPMRIKHEVEDPWQVNRSHPVFFGVQETFEEWTKALEQLQRQEAFVKLGNKTAKIRTLTVPPMKSSREELTRIKNEYAARLLRPKEDVAPAIDRPVAPKGRTVYRSVPAEKSKGAKT
jgi:hypothetical protein